jgi:NADPH:quinone reductase-like Zn-dependent oxidoreductase
LSAAVLKKSGDIELREVGQPVPFEGELLVKVKAASLAGQVKRDKGFDYRA